MVITVSCPSCSTSFPVDSAKVPPKGVNARCSTCGDIFRVEKPKDAAAAAATSAPRAAAPSARPAAPPPLPPPPAVEDSSDLGDIEVVPPPAPPVAAPARPAAPPSAPAARPAASAPSSTSSAPPAGGTFRFGKRDPTDKAKRLARVLVSDMIMYNAERHRNALENSTLAADFEDEIDKSWKEYRDQVGAEIADGEGRQFWREALNDILAKGERVF
jgi:predicted Zn finger-like uncharacterized protein